MIWKRLWWPISDSGSSTNEPHKFRLLIWFILGSICICRPTRLHGRSHHLPVLSAWHLCKMNLPTAYNSYSILLGRIRTHTNISNPITRPPVGSELSFYTFTIVLKPCTHSLLVHPHRVQHYYHPNFAINSNFFIISLITIQTDVVLSYCMLPIK